MVRAIADLAAITIEKARALEEASHAEAARQSELLKSALLDSLAHDIKTPLTSIKAAVTSLLGEAAAADRELLTIINEEADRLNQLAAEVVAMARIEAGKLHLEKRPGAGGADRHRRAGRSWTAAAQRPAPSPSTRPADLPAAEADPELAQQVVKQFLENALKYTPEDTPITVSAERKSGKIVIGVADRGPGIEEHERALIFDSFYRGREHRFRHQGNGHGTRHRQGNRGGARRTDLGGKRAAPGFGILLYAGRRGRRQRQLSAGKILVVDDDPQIRRVMKATLVGHSYEVIEARTGEEALEIFAARSAQPGAARYEHAGHGRPGNLPRHARRLRRAGDHAHGAQHGEGQGGGARCRRRRLRHQAVRHRRTAGAHSRGAAAFADRAGRRPAQLRNRRAWRSISKLAACARRARDVRLTPKEFELLRYLVAHAGKPVTHRELLQAVWGPDYGDEPEYLRVFINQVRKKIEANPAKPTIILTEPWVGYRLAAG